MLLMGFAFGIIFPIVLLVLALLAVAGLLLFLFTKESQLLKAVGIVTACLFALPLGIYGINIFLSKKEIDRNDIYGSYIIDRTKFPGKQSDWQYNTYRFEITTQNECLFHTTNREQILKTEKIPVVILDYYKNPHLVLKTDSTNTHIIDSMPTLYRTRWSFYYVFHSPKFGNVFFTKGEWDAIDD